MIKYRSMFKVSDPNFSDTGSGWRVEGGQLVLNDFLPSENGKVLDGKKVVRDLLKRFKKLGIELTGSMILTDPDDFDFAEEWEIKNGKLTLSPFKPEIYVD